MSKRSDAEKVAAILEHEFKWRALRKEDISFIGVRSVEREKAWRDGDNLVLTVDGAEAAEVSRDGKAWHWFLGGEAGEGKWAEVFF